MTPSRIATTASKLGRSLGATILSRAARNKCVVAYWWRGRANFGDELNRFVIGRLAGRQPIHFDDIIGGYTGPVYSAIGSILQSRRLPADVVWGSGFISQDSVFSRRPREIAAVRGPLTRDLVLRQGLPCPPIYGDPALLMPGIYTPNRRTDRTRLGLVPHYKDKRHPSLVRLAFEADVHLIDVQDDPLQVIDDICNCEAIASSSLHGIILALAYNIPAIWIDLSGNVKGDGFKFKDFFLAANIPVRRPHAITPCTTAAQLADAAVSWAVDVDLAALRASCPFLDRTRTKGQERSVTLDATTPLIPLPHAESVF